ncbi:MAG: type II secretion system protein [Firmicutes bacterium]|nr:type II secretion system protein [Bacillota bacterium]
MMKTGKQGGQKKLLAPICDKGFTLVEVLIVIMVIPLILGVSFGVMSAALSMYRAIDARSGLSSTGTHILEAIGQDIRGLAILYDTSSESRLNGHVYGHAADVDYQFIPPDSNISGVLTRNGKDMTNNGVSVVACEFGYMGSTGFESVPPDTASCVRVRFTLELRASSMTFESVFHMRNS